MIKVCHVSTAHKASDVRIFHKECVTLAANGYDVTLIANGEPETKSGVRIISFPNLSRAKRLLLGRYIALKLALDVDADIYHLHDPDLLLIAKKLKKKGKKVIFDSHENVSAQILTKSYIPKIIRVLTSKIYRLIEKFVTAHLDGIIIVTPSQFALFEKQQKNVQLVTNFPILHDFTVEERDKTTLRTPFRLCFAGGVSQQWGHKAILEAIENLPDVTYTVAGFAGEDYLEKLQKDYKEAGKLNYLGFVSKDKVADIYNTASCGMALLQYDTQVGREGTLGNTKLFEYMQAGLPIICSDLVLWKNIVEEYKCGITVNPENIIEIREAILFLKNNPDIANQYGKNGQEAFRNNFNWDTQVPQLLKTYENILATRLDDEIRV